MTHVALTFQRKKEKRSEKRKRKRRKKKSKTRRRKVCFKSNLILMVLRTHP